MLPKKFKISICSLIVFCFPFLSHATHDFDDLEDLESIHNRAQQIFTNLDQEITTILNRHIPGNNLDAKEKKKGLLISKYDSLLDYLDSLQRRTLQLTGAVHEETAQKWRLKVSHHEERTKKHKEDLQELTNHLHQNHEACQNLEVQRAQEKQKQEDLLRRGLAALTEHQTKIEESWQAIHTTTQDLLKEMNPQEERDFPQEQRAIEETTQSLVDASEKNVKDPIEGLKQELQTFQKTLTAKYEQSIATEQDRLQQESKKLAQDISRVETWIPIFAHHQENLEGPFETHGKNWFAKFSKKVRPYRYLKEAFQETQLVCTIVPEQAETVAHLTQLFIDKKKKAFDGLFKTSFTSLLRIFMPRS